MTFGFNPAADEACEGAAWYKRRHRASANQQGGSFAKGRSSDVSVSPDVWVWSPGLWFGLVPAQYKWVSVPGPATGKGKGPQRPHKQKQLTKKAHRVPPWDEPTKQEYLRRLVMLVYSVVIL